MFIYKIELLQNIKLFVFDWFLILWCVLIIRPSSILLHILEEYKENEFDRYSICSLLSLLFIYIKFYSINFDIYNEININRYSARRHILIHSSFYALLNF